VGSVSVRVVTTANRVVSRQAFGSRSAGESDLVLDLRDARGKRLSNGFYHLRVEAEGEAAWVKMLVLP
jgi:hypothetical protein